jgi:hypothetical protein
VGNILTAIKAIVEDSNLQIENITDGKNRMNNMGEGLEIYIKNAFANSLQEKDEIVRLEKISQTFSYTGNKTNPPDMMLWNGDAIEVKKIESANSNLQLNSSHPKSKLLITNTKINKACRECEQWSEKDLIYSIGYIKSKALKSLWMVYGDCYAADIEIYQKVEDKIKESINSLEDIEINTDTNELSGIKNVDPLNITFLRVRGMWIIENPIKVYNYLYDYDKKAKFQLIVLMRESKYETFSQSDRRTIETLDSLNIKNIKIKNPNNPANLIDAKLINFKVV